MILEGIWVGIAGILAIIGGPVVYFIFLSSKNEEKFTGFTAWLYDVLKFKKMLLETLLKVLYLISAIFITLAPLATVNFNFLTGLLAIIFGNIALRVLYEFSLITILIWKNTAEINRKLGKVEIANKDQ